MGVGVRLENVSLSLGGREVLRGVSLDALPGRRTAFVGPNGGGKTTLVRAILGFLKPESGRVGFVDGDGAPVPRPKIGYLPQRNTLSPDAPVSGVDLVALSLAPGPGFRSPRGTREEAMAALLRAGLDESLFARPVGRLSGGQRQRVLLARALAGTPPILLLDEPDTALDVEGMETLRDVIGAEVRAGRTVILVTHDSEAMGGADAVFRIDRTASVA